MSAETVGNALLVTALVGAVAMWAWAVFGSAVPRPLPPGRQPVLDRVWLAVLLMMVAAVLLGLSTDTGPAAGVVFAIVCLQGWALERLQRRAAAAPEQVSGR